VKRGAGFFWGECPGRRFALLFSRTFGEELQALRCEKRCRFFLGGVSG